MSETKEIDSSESERPSNKHRGQFSIRAMLLVPLLLVVFVGLAVIVDLYASHVTFWLFGIHWMSDTRSWLIGAGVPAPFVTGYVSFALLRLPGWTVLVGTTLVLGLRRSRHAHFLAWLLALAFPLSEVIGDSWFAASGFLPDVDTLLNFKIRVVSAFGCLLGIGAWYVGWLIRGRHYDRTEERPPTWISRSVQVAIWALVLAVSAYGWTALASLRSAV